MRYIKVTVRRRCNIIHSLKVMNLYHSCFACVHKKLILLDYKKIVCFIIQLDITNHKMSFTNPVFLNCFNIDYLVNCFLELIARSGMTQNWKAVK